jgi:alkanesulfonate monooxygenase SsuD/methylene tetrahydromethanopterin reductase-like flavin-dependent oxidoreductase (luciferase family)
MSSTLDVISGGRFELGIGAGWKEDEWVAYGYGFPDTPTRLAIFADHLEVITRMLGPGRATYLGEHASVQGAINVPKGLQSPRIPIIVGGNGRRVTFRLAARFADELNLVFLDPMATAEAMAVARERCEEIGRDPATLRLSLYAPDRLFAAAGQERVDTLARYADVGLDRIIAFLGRRAADPEAQAAFAEDVRAAGLPAPASEPAAV